VEYENQKPQGFMNWLKESVTVKLMFIGMLVLLLLIPSSMIETLINERAGRHEEMEKDVSDKWSASQLIQGPVLVIPYKRQYKEVDTNNKAVMKG
jgi:inner membrane protein